MNLEEKAQVLAGEKSPREAIVLLFGESPKVLKDILNEGGKVLADAIKEEFRAMQRKIVIIESAIRIYSTDT